MTVQTSGNDLTRASASFSNSAEAIRGQADALSESRVTGAVTGRKFPEVGDRYRQLIEQFRGTIDGFAGKSSELSEDFSASATQYDSSDEDGIGHVRSVQV
ncbi:hypothetical protein GIY23_19985 [Allosaccharopolyspora coralli]|uniref:Uncharacterized protein n=1 Tax=Allosaccharopolyspora coralli TaxID=2665642 RepID=A0A5Q3QDP4_9PSEU|nr:type VII secretion target [Allosaccharopolyspora coralli]QGK71486.1 hypothetical protein GIY23_19985 [Allosaccharopolyspora coralli]